VSAKSGFLRFFWLAHYKFYDNDDQCWSQGHIVRGQGQGHDSQDQGLHPQGQGLDPQGQELHPQGQGLDPQGQGLDSQDQGHYTSPNTEPFEIHHTV